jgi:hypothetical protein
MSRRESADSRVCEVGIQAVILGTGAEGEIALQNDRTMSRHLGVHG